jgi:Tfp pilus assembly protein PilX
MKIYTNKKGILLPVVMIFLVISLLLGMGILTLGNLESIAAVKRMNRQQAFYIAEAGAYRAYAHLKDNPGWEPEEEPVNVENETFSGIFYVLLEEDEEDEELLNIISTGTVNKTSETVTIVVYSSGGNTWSQGLFGAEKVTLKNNVKIYSYDSTTDPYGDAPGQDAKVGSVELITLENNATLYGDAYTADENGIPPPKNNSDITGTENEGYEFDEPLNDNSLPPVVIPPELLTASPGGKLEVTGGTRIFQGGDYRYEEVKTSGNSVTRFTGSLTRIYIEKKLEVENNSKWDIQGTLIIYLGEESELFVKNNAKIGVMEDGNILPNLPVDFRIYSASTKDNAVTMENNSDMAALLYVPDGGILIKNNRSFLGGIVTENLSFDNNDKILYDVSHENTQIDDDPGGGNGTGNLGIIRWTKPGWSNRLQ